MQRAEREVVHRGLTTLGAKSLSSLAWSLACSRSAVPLESSAGSSPCRGGGLGDPEAKGHRLPGGASAPPSGEEYFPALKVAMKSGGIFHLPARAGDGVAGGGPGGLGRGVEGGNVRGANSVSAVARGDGGVGGKGAAGGLGDGVREEEHVGGERGVQEVGEDVEVVEEESDVHQGWGGQQINALIAGIALFGGSAPGDQPGGRVGGRERARQRRRGRLRDELLALVAEVCRDGGAERRGWVRGGGGSGRVFAGAD